MIVFLDRCFLPILMKNIKLKYKFLYTIRHKIIKSVQKYKCIQNNAKVY